MIVRWGLAELPGVLEELTIARPFLVASPRWDELEIAAAERWNEIPSHRIEVPDGVDGVVAVGGGSAIDTAKAASAAGGLPLVSVPTTYSGSEWTSFYGVRDPKRRMRGGGAGAQLAGIVYEPELTLELPREPTVGTALNALAHSAEALYHPARDATSDRLARRGRRADRRLAARRRRGRRPTGARGRRCCAGRRAPARRSAGPAFASAMRWRKRSAVATDCRTAR